MWATSLVHMLQQVCQTSDVWPASKVIARPKHELKYRADTTSATELRTEHVAGMPQEARFEASSKM